MESLAETIPKTNPKGSKNHREKHSDWNLRWTNEIDYEVDDDLSLYTFNSQLVNQLNVNRQYTNTEICVSSINFFVMS